MAEGTNQRPIIIKRKKVVSGDGHHGGAWKVAYADFVTAMMAFFMLMWLLNATTEQQRKGIADYFSPTIPISRISGGGDGSFGGDSVFSETTIAQNGTGATNRRPTEGRQALGLQGTDHSAEREIATLEALEDALMGRGGDSMVSDLALPHVNSRLTDEGLVIEVFSRPGAPLFDPVTGEPAPWLPGLAAVMAQLFSTVTNRVGIAGHVAAEPLVVASESRWQTSTDRAQVMRLLLEAGGLPARRIARVTGHADRAPVAADPMAPRNDRLAVVLIRNDV
ncbi:Flagellar motor rotation protein MotB [Roseibacterium elongatum DSM 19469]|uniref:Flagellar motor rotation protein MotB n=1 Tax=Roseicyclus elongatus DSM 19469 TaxID=1294273 RepID=W8S4J7_9RHOB|nr:flagellar motor protein MotB [Roseibacterium elongatum]AHM03731.1 Flagellar motor rotation protein MotB [Roseibacterium elongatum DSM 19469]